MHSKISIENDYSFKANIFTETNFKSVFEFFNQNHTSKL